MKHEPIASDFSIGDRVVITAGDYLGQYGIVNRIGAAGYSIVYIHVAIESVTTIMTLFERQLRKA